VSSPNRIEPDGERKQVTVLFADVQGSMDLAEQHDPEQWREIMQGFFSILAEEVRRFEGTVDKFTGDGIMAVFGAPVAHEDHARRACLAALRMLDDIAEYAAELRRVHSLNFSARIGINSGEVIAGAIGSGANDDKGEYTAIGHTVGLAQRMEALAEPGKAYLTEATAELARGFLEFEDLGEFEIKGASRLVRVFELVGVGAARSRLDLSRERGFSRFVGRDAELAVLEEQLERAKAGEGGAVGIVAEPGVGKSRLCHELAERARREGIEVFECQGQAHGRELPFMPVLQMLRAYFGIADGDSERTVREKIAGRALLLDPAFADDLPLLFDFLGVPDPERPLPQLSAEARSRALRGVVCRLVRAPGRRDPIVTVIEDLHWIDEASEILLGELLGSVEGTQTLAIVNFRPEYEPSWTGPPDYHEISLQPLGPADTGELLRDLAGEDPSLDGLDDLIHERTAGNPFFIEEIVRALAESGHLEGQPGAYRLARPLEDVGVPVSVQAVLAARIDRLGAEAKRLLQAASVAGKEAPERTLGLAAGLEREEMDPLLRDLIESGFLYESELYPERVLAFRHPLTREVAYGSQLAEQRASTHAAVARAMVELNQDRHDEMAALIASHMEQGGETLEAAHWAARAAHWAGHSRPHDALRLWRTVMDLAGQMEESEETDALAITSRLLQLDFAWRLGMEREEAARLEAEAEKIATRSGDLRSLALLRMLLSGRPGLEQPTGEWIEGVAEANRLADESGDDYLRVAIRAAGAYSYLCAAEFEQLNRTADEVLELAGDDHGAGAGIIIGCPYAWALGAKAIVCRERGDLERCEQLVEQGLRIAEEQGDPETASWSRGSKAMLLAMQGKPEAGIAVGRRNCELTERLGDVFSRSLALGNLGTAQLAAEDYDGALRSFEEAERLHREAAGGGDEQEAWRGAIRAEALTGLGRAQEAIEIASWAAQTARKRELNWSLPLALLALGRARAASGVEGAREALDEAAAVATRTGAQTILAAVKEEREAIGAGAG
jgi:class 3 adenylate cyclase/tetratricopeptide (TPR) repeat protein